jgi:ABC-2 type transport system ATP-binding protein
VHEQLVYFARLHGAGPSDAAAAADRWSERLGVTERRADPVDALSLGNQLAATLVHEPSVLILDEPFSGLDPVAVDALAEEVSIIAEGKLVASGRVDELRARASDGRLVRVLVEGAPVDWYARLGEKREEDARGVVLRVREGSVDQELLDAARTAGRVHGFAPAEPTLAELFREAVSQP